MLWHQALPTLDDIVGLVELANVKDDVMRIILALFVLIAINCTAKPASIAFYYDEIDSVRELLSYDRVVVTPSSLSKKQLTTLQAGNTQVFAYLSVGEWGGVPLADSLSDAVGAKNLDWQSYAMDLTSPHWQQHLYKQSEAYLQTGFDGLFLDTLDSYFLFARKPQQQRNQQAALVSIIQRLAKISKQHGLILNRGFEVLPQVQSVASAVVAESLYHSYNPAKKKYSKVKASDSLWLNNKMATVKSLDLEAIVIDYIPGNNRQAQLRAARRLVKQGFTPYISDGLLSQIGVSSSYAVPRRVLVFYNGARTNMIHSSCHRFLAMPLEYLGYIPECQDIQSFDFRVLDQGKYAAVVSWLDTLAYVSQPKLVAWLNRLPTKLPLLYVGSLPQDRGILAKLGVNTQGYLSGSRTLLKGDNWIVEPTLLGLKSFDRYGQVRLRDKEFNNLIEVRDSQGERSTLFFTAPWGGAVLDPLPIVNLHNQAERWVIDPFNMLTEALSLTPLPVPDVTTESGRRVLTLHIDGDGFVSKAWFPGQPYASEMIMNKVLKPYKLPITVSVIEGEVGSRGLYPELSRTMERIAKKIFSLPHVELASHTYSHPFFWRESLQNGGNKNSQHLAIPGYELDLTREIHGSVDYINQTLAPKEKRVKVLLWSGEADPDEATIKLSDEIGVFNVNGGNTFVQLAGNSYSRVSPTIVSFPSGGVQVYAPVLNENLFTKLWTENYDGYASAIETFKLLGRPKRLKSISIYYHMYSGVYPASLKGLLKVYDWAQQQNLTPIHLSEYAGRASSLYQTGIGKSLSGQWVISSTGIRSLRLPDLLGPPNILLSEGVAGWNQGPDGKYLTLSQSRSRLDLSTSGNGPVFVQANAILQQWQVEGAKIHWRFQSYVPLELDFRQSETCQLIVNKAIKPTRLANGSLRYATGQVGEVSGTLDCRG